MTLSQPKPSHHYIFKVFSVNFLNFCVFLTQTICKEKKVLLMNCLYSHWLPCYHSKCTFNAVNAFPPMITFENIAI